MRYDSALPHVARRRTIAQIGSTGRLKIMGKAPKERQPGINTWRILNENDIRAALRRAYCIRNWADDIRTGSGQDGENRRAQRHVEPLCRYWRPPIGGRCTTAPARH